MRGVFGGFWGLAGCDWKLRLEGWDKHSLHKSSENTLFCFGGDGIYIYTQLGWLLCGDVFFFLMRAREGFVIAWTFS